jgi:pimeloyl-ACP methyl ester carboxylesterase
MRVLANGVHLFFDVEGAQLVPDGSHMRQRPVVIALHGGPGADHSTLKPALSPLADVAQIVYLDHRGHGRSDDGPQERWTLDQLADDVVAFCDALGIDHPIVYGQSLGAMIALIYAVRHPDHPRALLLVAASAVGYALSVERVTEAFRRVGGDRAAEVYRRDAELSTADSHEEWMVECLPYLSSQPSVREAMAEWRARIVPRPFAVHLALNTEMKTMDLRPTLSQITCPTLLLVGDRDPETPPEDSEEIAEFISKCRVVRIPDAGHTLFRDQPAAALREARRFIEVLESPTAPVE